MNLALCRALFDEICKAAFDLGKDKAPSPVCFTGMFFY